MELGISTFADLTPDPASGISISPHQRMKDLMEEIRLADQVGLDVYAIGEHHRPDFVVSSPAVVLGAAATITQKIRLSSAVTVCTVASVAAAPSIFTSAMTTVTPSWA